jgi:hypothetical protein
MAGIFTKILSLWQDQYVTAFDRSLSQKKNITIFKNILQYFFVLLLYILVFL